MANNNDERHVSLSDIQRRLKENPEPPIVTEIREKILSSFSDLRFDPIPHKYYRPDGKNGEYELQSVSAWVENFVEEVDWDTVREKKALKLGIDPEDLKEQWLYNNHRATTAGTVVHEYAENLANLMRTGDPNVITDAFKMQFEVGYLFPASPKQQAARDALEVIFNNPNTYFVLSETRVYSTKYAGTFDLLLYYNDPINPKNSGLKIVDWKTNVSLYNEYNQRFDKMMLEPFNFVVDEAYGHYLLQQSSYQIPIENLGYKVLSRTLVHLKDSSTPGVGEYEFVKLDDVTKTIRQLL